MKLECVISYLSSGTNLANDCWCVSAYGYPQAPVFVSVQCDCLWWMIRYFGSEHIQRPLKLKYRDMSENIERKSLPFFSPMKRRMMI